MRPGDVLDEEGEETRGGDGACSAVGADVGDVGEVALERFLVFLPQRQLPGGVGGAFAAFEERLGEGFVVAHEAGGFLAEGDDDGAGERGDVDEALGAVFALGVGEGIAQDEPPFGVGVEDLHRASGERAHDVARAGGRAAGEILGGGDDGHDVERELEPGDGF